ncbi:MAG: hypothetical protein ACRCWQ_10820 [Bacilli bacterium]
MQLSDIKRVAIIGSRVLPVERYRDLFNIATKFALNGTQLFSGGANGSDTAAELAYQQQSATHLSNIILPYSGFNSRPDWEEYYTLQDYHEDLIDEAESIISKIHPNWPLSGFARAAHTRNCFQVLGHDLNTPVDLVVCYAPKSGRSVKGGTRTAVNISVKRDIPVYNISDPIDREFIMKVCGLGETDLSLFM